MRKPTELAKHIAIEKQNILEPEFKDKGFRATKEWSIGGDDK